MQTIIWILLFGLILSGSLRGFLSEGCGIGKYTIDGICKECPSSCETCLSEYHCQVCKPDFFGQACSKHCSNACKSGLCSQETGKCASCAEGYFLNDDSVCENCPEHCTICDSETRCAICEVGFKGDLCQETCTNCKPGTGCSKDTGICSDGCLDGYSGISCVTKCNSKCRSCNRQDPETCTSCASDRYGFKCENPCSTNCQDNTCSQNNGMCTHGCRSGFWGSMCEDVCPTKCKYSKCFRHNGFCFDGCEGNYTGSECKCPSECTCDSNGTCERCIHESEFACDKNCSEGCIGSMCRQDTKECLQGCRDGYIGKFCSAFKDSEEDTREGAGSSGILLVAVLVSVVIILIIIVAVIVRMSIKRGCIRCRRSKTGSENRTEDAQQLPALRQSRGRSSGSNWFSQLLRVFRQGEEANYAAIGESKEILQNTDNTADAADADTENTEHMETLVVSLCENKDSAKKVDALSDYTYDKTFTVNINNKGEDTIKYATWPQPQKICENKVISLKQERRRKSLEEESKEKECEHPVHNVTEDGLCPHKQEIPNLAVNVSTDDSYKKNVDFDNINANDTKHATGSQPQEIRENKDIPLQQEIRRTSLEEGSRDKEFEHPIHNETDYGICPRIQEIPNHVVDVSTDDSNVKNVDIDNIIANDIKHATSSVSQKLRETKDIPLKHEKRRESWEEDSPEGDFEFPIDSKSEDELCSLLQAVDINATKNSCDEDFKENIDNNKEQGTKQSVGSETQMAECKNGKSQDHKDYMWCQM